MSTRARNARRLASLIGEECDTWVRIAYHRDRRAYVVEWSDGPEILHMHRLAVKHAEAAPDLDVTSLLWNRVHRGREAFKVGSRWDG